MKRDIELFLFNKNTKPVINAWIVAWSDNFFRLKLLLIPVLFFLYSAITQHLGYYVEMRKGAQLEDKLLALFPSFDCSANIFLLLYGSFFAVILINLDKPRIILRIIEMHFFVAIARQLCILLVALEPPQGMIVLRDVFLENTVYPHNNPLTKDLFFSGHVASIWIYFLCARQRYLKVYMGVATLLMSFMILSMRIHYTYDIYGAVFITTIIYYAPDKVRLYYAKLQMN